MIKLFGGTDVFESYYAAKNFAKERSVATASTLEILDSDKLKDIGELLEKVEGVGMFAENTLLLIKRPFENKKLLEQIFENIEKLNGFEIVLWHDAKPDGKLKLVKWFKKNGKLVEFENPKPWQLAVWLKKELSDNKIKLTQKQIEYILEHIPNDKFSLKNEMQKLKIYLNKSSAPITDETLANILGYDAKGDVWKFLDYFSEQQKEKAWKEFKKLIRFEENVQYLISMLARELSLMIQLKTVEEEGGDFKNLKQHPFVLQKTIKKAKKYSLKTLAELAKALLETDVAIKSGQLTDQTAIKVFLLG